MKYFFCLLTLAFSLSSQAQVFFHAIPAGLDFGTRQKNQVDSLEVMLRNDHPQRALMVTDLNIYNKDFYVGGDTAFLVAPGASRSVWVKFRPRHNITYNSELVVVSPTFGSTHIDLKGICQYPGTYYAATFDKQQEALKDALRQIMNAGYVSLGYNVARDWMFLTIDNQQANGSGAVQNTLECIYTGRQAIGYTSRSDAQTNFNFNTEHTYPQSKFNSSEPMQSDLFHLFPVDEGANSVRSNDPFGVVFSPNWQVGGSSSDGSVFEPRARHKGNAARALLYFGVKYQNFQNFLTLQETTLRTWNSQFPPDRTDSLRNEKIFTLQKNRNAFIDHPEFLERISSVSVTSIAPEVRTLDISRSNTFISPEFSLAAFPGDSAYYSIVFIASGNQPVTFSCSLATAGQVSLDKSTFTLQPGDAGTLFLQLFAATEVQGTDTLVVYGNATNATLVKIPFSYHVTTVGIAKTHELQGVRIFPNPAGQSFTIEKATAGDLDIQLTDISGRVVFSDVLNRPLTEISLLNRVPGVYFVRIISGQLTTVHKLVVR